MRNTDSIKVEYDTLQSHYRVLGENYIYIKTNYDSIRVALGKLHYLWKNGKLRSAPVVGFVNFVDDTIDGLDMHDNIFEFGSPTVMHKYQPLFTKDTLARYYTVLSQLRKQYSNISFLRIQLIDSARQRKAAEQLRDYMSPLFTTIRIEQDPRFTNNRIHPLIYEYAPGAVFVFDSTGLISNPQVRQ